MLRESSLVVGHRKSLFVPIAHAVKMYSWESPNLVREILTEDVLRGSSEQSSEACLEPIDWGSGHCVGLSFLAIVFINICNPHVPSLSEF